MPNWDLSRRRRKSFPLGGGALRSESQIYMIAGGNHTMINSWQKSLIFD
jgi:hypothetical protein